MRSLSAQIFTTFGLLFAIPFRLWVVNENSTEYANFIAKPMVKVDVDKWLGRMRIFYFSFTRTAQGAAGSLCNLLQLPGGRVRLILPLSRIHTSALGASRTMDIGWLAHTDHDGDAVAADPNGLDDGVDVSSAVAFNPGGTVGTDETYLFNSRDGVVLTAQVNDGTWDAAETLSGYFVAIND